MLKDPLNITYTLLFITIVVTRKIQTSKAGNQQMDKPSPCESLILTCTGLSMLSPFLYIFTGFLQFAEYQSPNWLRWLGIPFFLGAIWLLWKSHRDLGTSWNYTVLIAKEHHLVTTGVFGYIRHPMYAAHFLWALAQLIMIPNWLIGPSLFLFTWILYRYRISREEAALADLHGEKYRHYQRSTGKLFPRKFTSFSG